MAFGGLEAAAEAAEFDELAAEGGGGGLLLFADCEFGFLVVVVVVATVISGVCCCSGSGFHEVDFRLCFLNGLIRNLGRLMKNLQ